MILHKLGLHGPVHSMRFTHAPFGKKFALVPVHCYWVDGLLIDTAQSHARKKLLERIQSYKVQQIILTHHHEDHSGNVAALMRHFNIPAYADPETVRKVAAGVPVLFYQRLSFGAAEKAILQPITGEINSPNYRFEIIPCPGHCPDHIALHEANEGWLFSGDMYVHDRVKYFKKGESIPQQIQSIQKLLTYDFEILFCAHNPQFKNGAIRLKAKLQYLQDLEGKILELKSKGWHTREIIRKAGLRESFKMRLLSGGDVSVRNMVQSVIDSM